MLDLKFNNGANVSPDILGFHKKANDGKDTMDIRNDKNTNSPIVFDSDNAPFEINYQDFKAMRDDVRNWLKTLQGRAFTNADTGEKILLSRRGINELVSHIGNDAAYTKSLAIVPQIIRKMRYLETKPNSKNDRYAEYSYFVTPVKIDGKDYTVSSVVGKNENGEYYYHQRIFEGTSNDVIEKAKGAHNSAPTAEVGAAMRASATNNITKKTPKVNSVELMEIGELGATVAGVARSITKPAGSPSSPNTNITQSGGNVNKNFDVGTKYIDYKTTREYEPTKDNDYKDSKDNNKTDDGGRSGLLSGKKIGEHDTDGRNYIDGMEKKKTNTENEPDKKVYSSNFSEGTPTSAKSKRVLELIQDVWSKKPIPLNILNSDGSVARQIEAQFDPTYDPDIPTDAGKLAAGQRYGSRGNKTVALDLADNWYEIIEGSTYHSSALEEGKAIPTHEGVKEWHYFINDIMFQKRGESEPRPYRVIIDVKERNDGNFVYSVAVQKPKTLGTPTANLSAGVPNGNSSVFTTTNNIIQSGEKVNSKEKKDEKKIVPPDDNVYSGGELDATIAQSEEGFKQKARQRALRKADSENEKNALRKKENSVWCGARNKMVKSQWEPLQNFCSDVVVTR